MTIILIASNLLFLIIGLIVGHKIPKEEKVMPNLNPVKIYENIKTDIENNKEAERYKIIAENIDNYDGTGLGQKDIPR